MGTSGDLVTREGAKAVELQAKIVVESVSHSYVTRGGALKAVENVSMSVAEGEFVALVGPSGCGKSTLLHMIAGLLDCTEGSISVNGGSVTGPHPSRGVVFQADSVFPWMTVEQNIAYGLRCKGEGGDRVNAQVSHYLEKVDLVAHRKLYPRELSGGMRKRVELARAYANEPDVLLLDEPFGSLDALTREAMQLDLIRMSQGEQTRTVVLVTHDIEEAVFLADRVIVMTPRPARVVDSYTVNFTRPRDPGLITSREFQQLRYEIRNRLEVTVT